MQPKKSEAKKNDSRAAIDTAVWDTAHRIDEMGEDSMRRELTEEFQQERFKLLVEHLAKLAAANALAVEDLDGLVPRVDQALADALECVGEHDDEKRAELANRFSKEHLRLSAKQLARMTELEVDLVDSTRSRVQGA